MAFRNAALVALAMLLCALGVHAQASDTKPGPASCANAIPFGVRVVRIPEAEQRKVTISDFKVSTNKDATGYDLAMHIKNGADNWCITSLALTYLLGDARGQEWTANEYPAVMGFKSQSDATASPKARKSTVPVNLLLNSIGMAPGKDEERVVIGLYDYIQPRPTGLFDGFHLISAEIKYCMGYSLTSSK